jgi:hypothetical protein
VDAPGGRYKIIERGRRLVTIDTLTGQEVTTIPATSHAPITDTGRDTITAAPERATSGSAMGGPARGVQSMGARSGDARATPGKPRAALVTMAGMMPGARIDENDRIVLMTRPTYDPKAPRLVRLTTEKTKALGALVVAAILVLMVAALFMLSGHFVMIVVIAIVALQVGKPTMKPVMANLISDAEDIL